MRAGGALLVFLLLVAASAVLQVSSAAEDLYWEGEEDASNEFLEVKDDKSSIGTHLRRLKRDFFDWLNIDKTSTTTAEPDNYESITEDQAPVDEDITPDEKDDDQDYSGFPVREAEQEPKEKTLRVTFVVIQPYQTEYSNRDSPQFQSFSKSLAESVNLLFDSLPGTQRASLVRIQSVVDEFACKVTLDIVTTGYEDTARITDMLRDHIRRKMMLGSVVVKDVDFSATVIDPADWDNRDQDQTPATTERIPDSRSWTTLPPPAPTSWLPWDTEDPVDQMVEEDDLKNEIATTTEQPRQMDTCPNDELRCDETRCVPLTKRCDSVQDCYDGADEADCESGK